MCLTKEKNCTAYDMTQTFFLFWLRMKMQLKFLQIRHPTPPPQKNKQKTKIHTKMVCLYKHMHKDTNNTGQNRYP